MDLSEFKANIINAAGSRAARVTEWELSQKKKEKSADDDPDMGGSTLDYQAPFWCCGWTDSPKWA